MKGSDERNKMRLSVTLDEDLVIRLKDLAKRDFRTLSNYINHILREVIIRKNCPEIEEL